MVENDRLSGGYFVVSVTALPSLLDEAIEACHDSLDSLIYTNDTKALPKFRGISDENVKSARISVKSKLIRDAASTQHFAEELLSPKVLILRHDKSCFDLR